MLQNQRELRLTSCPQPEMDELLDRADIFGAAFAALPEAACIVERVAADDSEKAHWRFVASNMAMQQVFGLGDLAGQRLGANHPDFAERWSADCDRVYAGGVTETVIHDAIPYPGIFRFVLTPMAGSRRPSILAVITDITAEQKTRQTLLDSDSRYRSLFNAIDEGFCIIELVYDPNGWPVDYRFLEANKAFVQHTGLVDVLGKTMRSLEPDIEQEWVAAYASVARTGETLRFEQESPSMGRWFDVFAFPVDDTKDRRVGILFEDITERKRMEIALRDSESRLASLIDASSDIIFKMNPDWSELCELQGRGLVAVGGEPVNWVDDHLLPEDQPEMRAAIAEAVQGVKPFELEHRARKADGTVGWFFTRAVPILNSADEIAEWFGMATDVTERHRAEEELLHGTQMLRMASEIGGVALWDWHVGSDEVTWSAEHYRLAGYKVGEVDPSFALWRESVHPEDLESVEAAIQHSLSTGLEYVKEYRLLHRDGKIEWVLARGRCLYDRHGQPIRMLGAMIETTERRRQEEWHKLLVAELQHRVRNLISMVRSVARQSAPSHDDVDDYVDHLIGRLQAMGRTQGMLTRLPGTSVDLSSIVREELLVHAASEDDCRIEGPDIALSPHAAEIVTLAVHELATNSIKYGALGGEGHVRINWTTETKDGAQWIALRWQETVRDRVDTPQRKGFGSQLIEDRIPYELNGEGRLNVHDTGVLAELSFPLKPGASILETGSGWRYGK